MISLIVIHKKYLCLLKIYINFVSVNALSLLGMHKRNDNSAKNLKCMELRLSDLFLMYEMQLNLHGYKIDSNLQKANITLCFMEN